MVVFALNRLRWEWVTKENILVLFKIDFPSSNKKTILAQLTEILSVQLESSKVSRFKIFFHNFDFLLSSQPYIYFVYFLLSRRETKLLKKSQTKMIKMMKNPQNWNWVRTKRVCVYMKKFILCTISLWIFLFQIRYIHNHKY